MQFIDTVPTGKPGAVFGIITAQHATALAKKSGVRLPRMGYLVDLAHLGKGAYLENRSGIYHLNVPELMAGYNLHHVGRTYMEADSYIAPNKQKAIDMYTRRYGPHYAVSNPYCYVAVFGWKTAHN